MTTDGLGNLPSPIFAAPGVYKLSVTGSGITPSLLTATVAGTGGGNVVLNANNAFTGNDTFAKWNAVCSVDGTANTTIDQAIAACQPGPSLVIIPSNYAGAESVNLTTPVSGQTIYTGQDNITVWDFRASTNKAYNVNYGGTVLGALTRFACTQAKTSPTTTTSCGLFNNFITGTFPANSGSLAGLTVQTTLYGTLAAGGVNTHVLGIESYVEYVPTNAFTLPTDARAYTASVNIDRTNAAGIIPTAVGYYAGTHTNVSLSGGSMVNAYGFECAPQVNGTSRNYCLHAQQSVLFDNNNSIDFLTSGGAIYKALYVNASNQTQIRPASDANGIDVLTQAGVGLFNVNVASVISRVPHIFSSNGSLTEIAAPSGVGSSDLLWGDSTAHRLKMNNNNAGADTVGDTLVQDCGTTTTCSHTNLLNPQIVKGSVALSSGTPSTATVTGFSPAFASSSSFVCTVSNATTQGNPLKVVNASASSITITGPNTVTDTANYLCVGN